MIFFWYFFIQGKNIGKRHLVLAFIFENIVRCIFMAWEKDFIAYMLLPNWLTIFLLGMYLHDRRQLKTSPYIFVLIMAWLITITLQTYFANLIGFDHPFPFRNMDINSQLTVPVESLLISATYIVHTLFFFEIARRLPGHSVISFFARATLITVIIHIPIIFETHQYFYKLFASEDVARIVFIFVIYIGTAMVSEIIHKFIDIKVISEKFWLFFTRILMKFSHLR